MIYHQIILTEDISSTKKLLYYPKRRPVGWSFWTGRRVCDKNCASVYIK